jgi:hypothetical protein
MNTSTAAAVRVRFEGQLERVETATAHDELLSSALLKPWWRWTLKRRKALFDELIPLNQQADETIEALRRRLPKCSQEEERVVRSIIERHEKSRSVLHRRIRSKLLPLQLARSKPTLEKDLEVLRHLMFQDGVMSLGPWEQVLIRLPALPPRRFLFEAVKWALFLTPMVIALRAQHPVWALLLPLYAAYTLLRKRRTYQLTTQRFRIIEGRRATDFGFRHLQLLSENDTVRVQTHSASEPLRLKDGSVFLFVLNHLRSLPTQRMADEPAAEAAVYRAKWRSGKKASLGTVVVHPGGAEFLPDRVPCPAGKRSQNEFFRASAASVPARRLPLSAAELTNDLANLPASLFQAWLEHERSRREGITLPPTVHVERRPGFLRNDLLVLRVGDASVEGRANDSVATKVLRLLSTSATSVPASVPDFTPMPLSEPRRDRVA